jgi:hypothetical protein
MGIIVSTAVALYFYRKSRRIKLLAYTVSTAYLIQDYSAKLSGLKIEYKGKNPPNISVSRIAIWNAGTETINRGDIAEAEPLYIVSQSEILDWSVISRTAPANQFALTQLAAVVLPVGFDYLDSNDGAIIQLVHTGKPSDNIILSGRVKGSGQAVRRDFGPHPTMIRISDSFVGPSAALVIIGTLSTINTTGSLHDYSFLGVLIGVVFFSSSLVLSYLAGRFGTVPKKFESARNVV